MKRRSVSLMGGALIALNLSGCLFEDVVDEPVEIAFSVVTTGQDSGIVTERFEVIKEHSNFTGLWLDHAKGLSPAPAQPDIDFSQDMVIAVFLGERTTTGYGIKIAGVEEQRESLMVSVKATLPGVDCEIRQELSQPHQIVTVPRSGKVVTFATAVERVDCQ